MLETEAKKKICPALCSVGECHTAFEVKTSTVIYSNCIGSKCAHWEKCGFDSGSCTKNNNRGEDILYLLNGIIQWLKNNG